jgi:hypothetical protein
MWPDEDRCFWTSKRRFYIAPFINLISFFKVNIVTSILELLKLNLGFIFNVNTLTSASLPNYNSSNSNTINYSSNNMYTNPNPMYSFLEQENLSRFSRFSNPIISYDYKCGNYIGI